MLGYRAYFEVSDRNDVKDVALDQLREWLRGKGHSTDGLVPDRVIQLAPDVEALLIDLQDHDGSSSLRVQVIERKSAGAWTSELTVRVPAVAGPASLLVDIHSPATDGAPRVATGIPRLARGLLETLDAKDSLARLTDRPILVRAGAVPDLADAICDPDRRGLLFVAGSADSLPLGAWRKYVATLLRQTSGLASSYVLDADATRLLADALGPTHAVKPGTVRTFHPHADPGNELDARRHQILSTTRIVNDRSQWLAGILGGKARELALEQDLPDHVEALVRRFRAHADELLLGRLAPRPASAPDARGAVTEDLTPSADLEPTASGVFADGATTEPEPTELTRQDESYLAAAAAMRQVLGVSDPTPDDWISLAKLAAAGQKAERSQAEVAARLDELRTDLEQSNQDRRNLARRVEDEQLEHAATYEGRSEVEAELNRLRAMLVRTELAAEVYVRPESEAGDETAEIPTSFVEIMNSIGDLAGIEFTGDPEMTVKLDVHEQLGVWASKAWAILAALSDYAVASVAGRCDRDVHGYLLNLPDGCRGYSANKHAANESEDVQKSTKFSEARLFPVPTSVDSSGEVAMMAHFKIAQSGLISPRLHYFDDVRRTGKVYIGYVGPHLPTKRTN